MLAYLRRLSSTWVAQLLFVLLAIAFAGWGVSGDVLRMLTHSTWAAKVGGASIEPEQVQAAYRRQLDQFTGCWPGEPTFRPKCGGWRWHRRCNRCCCRPRS